MGCKLHLQEPPPLHETSPVALQDDSSFAENHRVCGWFAFFSALVATPKSLQIQQGIPCNGCCVKMGQEPAFMQPLQLSPIPNLLQQEESILIASSFLGQEA